MSTRTTTTTFTRAACAIAVAGALVASAGNSGAVAAASDPTSARTRPTAWYWNNNDDRDARGRFKHYGDTFQLCSWTDNDIYIDYDEYINGENIKRFEIEADLGRGECRSFTDNMEEGIWMAFKVCQQWRFAGDDCSDWVRVKVM